MLGLLRWTFLLTGLGLLAGAGYAAWREVEFRRGAVETDGRVVAMRPSTSRGSNGGTSTTYAPVFTFALPDGTQRRVEGGVSSSPPCCRVGDTVRVRYRPEAPERAQMTGFMESWFVATLLGGMGLVFTLVGVVVVRMTRSGALRALPALLPLPSAAAGGAPGPMTFAVPLVGLRRIDAPGGPRWVLQARWADPRSGVQRLFESEPLPFDPVPQMRAMSAVNVAFDPGRPDSPYWMDLSFLREPDADATVVQRRG